MKTIQHRFVEFIPEILEDGILYITVEYRSAVHKCICGCGNKVVTPISPTDWRLTFNGKSISLYPSIGNWSFSCRSHYWITKNEIIHAPIWTEKEIRKGRRKDKKRKRMFLWKRTDKNDS